MDLFQYADSINYPEPKPELAKTREQEFKAWKDLQGSRHVLKWCHKFAAVYWKDFTRYGVRCSTKLIWEQVRRKIRVVRAECARKGIDLKPYAGYVLNNSFTGYVSRHLTDHYPEYAQMLEQRELKTNKPIVKGEL